MLPDLRVAVVVASFLCCVIFYKLFHLQAYMSMHNKDISIDATVVLLKMADSYSRTRNVDMEEAIKHVSYWYRKLRNVVYN